MKKKLKADEPRVFNIVNGEALTHLCEAYSKKPHIRKWFATTWRKHLQTREDMMRVFVHPSTMTALGRIIAFASERFPRTEAVIDKLFGPCTRTIPLAELPAWVVNAQPDEDLFVFNVEDYSKSKLHKWASHARDFLEQEESKALQIGYDLAGLQEAVKRWDEKIARQKLLTTINDGCKVIRSWPELNIHLVSLETEIAYKNEGSDDVASNCVGGYWSRRSKHHQVYSLRWIDNPETIRSICTIEISRGKCVQAQGPFNKPIQFEHMAMIVRWAVESDITVGNIITSKAGQYINSSDGDEDEGEDDEECDDDEDEEDDEECDDDGDEDAELLNEDGEPAEDDDDEPDPTPRRLGRPQRHRATLRPTQNRLMLDDNGDFSNDM